MRITSWNVNGLRAVAKKGFLDWVEEHDPDVLLLQETKAQEDALPEELREIPGYVSRFHSAEKKGYSGVAIYSRYDVEEWIVGLGDGEYDCEGRVLSARFGDVIVTSAYFPNSQDKGKRIDYKVGFCQRMLEFLNGHVKAGRHIVLGGDYNIAHQPIDLARPKENEGNAGYLPEERAWMTEFLEAGYADVWRERNPERADIYSWWSYRTRARERNIGWRIDYLCVDAALRDQVRGAEVLMEVEGSDHCPVTLDIRNPV
jgi:exodeoxyribonuclease-3